LGDRGSGGGMRLSGFFWVRESRYAAGPLVDTSSSR
jgi:hypothetical protein